MYQKRLPPLDNPNTTKQLGPERNTRTVPSVIVSLDVGAAQSPEATSSGASEPIGIELSGSSGWVSQLRKSSAVLFCAWHACTRRTTLFTFDLADASLPLSA